MSYSNNRLDECVEFANKILKDYQVTADYDDSKGFIDHKMKFAWELLRQNKLLKKDINKGEIDSVIYRTVRIVELYHLLVFQDKVPEFGNKWVVLDEFISQLRHGMKIKQTNGQKTGGNERAKIVKEDNSKRDQKIVDYAKKLLSNGWARYGLSTHIVNSNVSEGLSRVRINEILIENGLPQEPKKKK